ncbi:MAG: hypothetical protein J6K32_03795 [Clostridia bacterium]|nr:hypothetical protein [Clostridia bacterium]
MIDIHMHLVPGVDDGAVDMPMALQMMGAAHVQGVRGIIAAPHDSAFLGDSGRTRACFAALRAQASRLFPQMRLALGAEIYLGSVPRVLERLRSGQLPTLNGTEYVLVEFSPRAREDEVRRALGEVAGAGWRPVAAHAERSPLAFGSERFAQEMIRGGALIQINAYSLAQEPDAVIRDAARRLLHGGLAHFFGTDAHRMNHRSPQAAQGLAYIRENCPGEYAQAIISGNAERLLGMG